MRDVSIITGGFGGFLKRFSWRILCHVPALLFFGFFLKDARRFLGILQSSLVTEYIVYNLSMFYTSHFACLRMFWDPLGSFGILGGFSEDSMVQ